MDDEEAAERRRAKKKTKKRSTKNTIFDVSFIHFINLVNDILMG